MDKDFKQNIDNCFIQTNLFLINYFSKTGNLVAIQKATSIGAIYSTIASPLEKNKLPKDLKEFYKKYYFPYYKNSYISNLIMRPIGIVTAPHNELEERFYTVPDGVTPYWKEDYANIPIGVLKAYTKEFEDVVEANKDELTAIYDGKNVFTVDESLEDGFLFFITPEAIKLDSAIDLEISKAGN